MRRVRQVDGVGSAALIAKAEPNRPPGRGAVFGGIEGGAAATPRQPAGDPAKRGPRGYAGLAT